MYSDGHPRLELDSPTHVRVIAGHNNMSLLLITHYEKNLHVKFFSVEKKTLRTLNSENFLLWDIAKQYYLLLIVGLYMPHTFESSLMMVVLTVHGCITGTDKCIYIPKPKFSSWRANTLKPLYCTNSIGKMQLLCIKRINSYQVTPACTCNKATSG